MIRHIFKLSRFERFQSAPLAVGMNGTALQHSAALEPLHILHAQDSPSDLCAQSACQMLGYLHMRHS